MDKDESTDESSQCFYKYMSLKPKISIRDIKLVKSCCDENASEIENILEQNRIEYIVSLLKDGVLKVTAPLDLNDPFEAWSNRAGENLEEWFSNFFADENNFIASLSKCWKIIPMWSHYASDHEGFCIGLNKDSNNFKDAKKVYYHNKYSENNQKFYSKHESWVYEKEVRLVILDGVKGYLNKDNGLRFVNVKNSISEVIAGLHSSEDHKKQIFKICQQEDIPFFEIDICEEGDFAFKKKSINSIEEIEPSEKELARKAKRSVRFEYVENSKDFS